MKKCVYKRGEEVPENILKVTDSSQQHKLTWGQDVEVEEFEKCRTIKPIDENLHHYSVIEVGPIQNCGIAGDGKANVMLNYGVLTATEGCSVSFESVWNNKVTGFNSKDSKNTLNVRIVN